MKYPKFLWLCVAVFVSIFVLAPEGFSQGPIKLGAIFPLADITGDQGAKAMKLAVKEINKAGGLLGRQVELIVVDDEMKPEKGAAAVEKLATVDKVDLLIGGMASGVHLGQIPIMKKYEKITVWIGAASSRCEQAVGASRRLVLPPPSLGLPAGGQLPGRVDRDQQKTAGGENQKMVCRL